ncbi:clasp N terminal-domain-containing protein [Podospora appendiculata]|uniref:Clasp N terminal-domain-containing protein n=1 Tax=Podospora appendiculata TaxID=314037 RepID=A0AAE1CCI1_9PEZI|nr:clasp N terminal-domain-containing protein [Podospora appendiculata]
MAEKINEDQVADLAALLRTEASIDTKVQQITLIKSGIKQHNVPDSCIAPLFEALRTASTSQHGVLVNAGFTSLNHLLARLARQDPKYLAKEAARTLPLIVEKLGDQKDKFRSLALQALATLYKAAPVDVERSVRNTAMAGKNPRAKEASLQWLLQMHQENGLQFRSYVPTLMELLEDADPMVRDAAKSTVIELFRNAPNAAKSDLKRQLKTFKVRPAIEQAIVKELAPTGSAPSSQADAPEEYLQPTRAPKMAASVSSHANERPITPAPENRPEQVEPMYVNTQRELDDIFRDMQIHFEGRETEQNWLKREESMTKLRKLMAGNAETDFHDAFLSGLRGLLDGIIKGSNSLRTSLSKEGCTLVQEIARIYGPGMDPMVELLLQTFIKLCAATKKIASQQANVTVDAIMGRATYNARIMQHVWGACQDKNVQPRLYAAGWLRTIFNKEAHHKSHIEHAGGLDLVDKCIKKGLTDPNPSVREQMRSTYWMFAGLWPARADAIMGGLDANAQKLLQNDSHNPNSPKKSEGAPARPALGLSKSTMASSKPSLRETLMAQKKAMASAPKNLPARPGSAMSHFSPVRTVSGSSHASTTSIATAVTTTTTTASTVRTRLEPPHGGASGGISGAPMRPTKRRPEIAARPATAGPYSVRTHDQPSAEQSSPEALRAKAVTPKPMAVSPKRTAPRAKPGHVAAASESSIASPTRTSPAKTIPSPRMTTTPSRPKQTYSAMNSSPPNTHENLTLIVPTARSQSPTPPQGVQPARIPAQAEEEIPVDPVSIAVEVESVPVPIEVLELAPDTPSQQPPLKVYEDPFTENQATPKPSFSLPVLEDKPVNEDAAGLHRPGEDNAINGGPPLSPEKSKQNLRLLDSGISKVQQKSLDVHGFRKLQSVIRDNKAVFTHDKFDALLSSLFEFLESPMAQTPPEKVQDVRAQILATIKLLLKRSRDSFQPHVSRGLESLLRARAAYDGRTHIVSGLELLADELVTLGDASEITLVLSRMLGAMDMDTPSFRSLSMGLHVLKEMIEARTTFMPTDSELNTLAGLASRCLESVESAVRMDAVHLCVALHDRVGDARIWEALRAVKDDSKSVITYYIVKRQRERDGPPVPV